MAWSGGGCLTKPAPLTTPTPFHNTYPPFHNPPSDQTPTPPSDQAPTPSHNTCPLTTSTPSQNPFTKPTHPLRPDTKPPPGASNPLRPDTTLTPRLGTYPPSPNYGQCAGNTNPTGMHTCLASFFSRVFHDCSTTQEWQYCRHHFGHAI